MPTGPRSIFIDAQHVIKENPNPAFDRIDPRDGYRFEYCREEAGPFVELTIRVMLGDTQIALAEFCENWNFDPQNIKVDEGHQRRGLGTAIYVLAEKITGKTLQNLWANDPIQSVAAKRLWAQKDRQFGNPTA